MAEAGLRFHKLHGAGNDFVLVDLRDQPADVNGQRARQLADRRFGVGCDQLLLLDPPGDATRDVDYRILNADGGPAGQCGNGVRCIALYLQMFDRPDAKRFTLGGPAGRILVERCEDGEFEADMGVPAFEPERVPTTLKPINGCYRLDSDWGPVQFAAASMGNPHVLIEVPEIGAAPVQSVGAWLSRHTAFPEGCNVGFAEVVHRGQIRLRVCERGVGETLACGSGACAAVAILRMSARVDETVEVLLPGGVLVIKWSGNRQSLRMKGPATYVFGGTMSHE